MTADNYISVRDWRRKPPLRLRVTKKLDICWCWIKCTRCPHMRAVAIAPFVIRWGPDGWQDMLRATARCTECGKRGVELRHPSWGGSDTGWAAMPISQMVAVPSFEAAHARSFGDRCLPTEAGIASQHNRLRPAVHPELVKDH